MLFNRKVNARLNMINLNPDPIKEEHKSLLSKTSRKLEYYTKVTKYGSVLSRTGTVMYKIKGYLCYKMITSQNVSSEAKVKNFFIS